MAEFGKKTESGGGSQTNFIQTEGQKMKEKQENIVSLTA